jgi:hypothetical protein
MLNPGRHSEDAKTDFVRVGSERRPDSTRIALASQSRVLAVAALRLALEGPSCLQAGESLIICPREIHPSRSRTTR